LVCSSSHLGALHRRRLPRDLTTPLLCREPLGPRDQLLELGESKPLANPVRLVSPQEIPDPRGHLQPPAHYGIHTNLLAISHLLSAISKAC